MNKKDLIDAISNKNPDISKKAIGAVLTSATEIIKDTVGNDEKVLLAGFGTFERRPRSARIIIHPSTGEAMKIPKKNVAYFNPGSEFKKRIAAGKKRGRKKKIIE